MEQARVETQPHYDDVSSVEGENLKFVKTHLRNDPKAPATHAHTVTLP